MTVIPLIHIFGGTTVLEPLSTAFPERCDILWLRHCWFWVLWRIRSQRFWTSYCVVRYFLISDRDERFDVNVVPILFYVYCYSIENLFKNWYCFFLRNSFALGNVGLQGSPVAVLHHDDLQILVHEDIVAFYQIGAIASGHHFVFVVTESHLDLS